MPSSPTEPLVVVTQADRLLFKMVVTGMVGPTKHNAIDSGGFDSDERMQYIARHRLAAPPDAGARPIAARWAPVRAEVESESAKSFPEWAGHLVIGGYREQGWAAFDQNQSGKLIASGKWGDALILLADGTISDLDGSQS